MWGGRAGWGGRLAALSVCQLVSLCTALSFLPWRMLLLFGGWILLSCARILKHKAGSLKMNTALEYSTRVVQEGGRRCKKSTLNDLVHLTPLRIPLMNPPIFLAYY